VCHWGGMLHNGVHWYVTTHREKRVQMAADDRQDGQEQFVCSDIRRLEEGTIREEGVIF
jgi:hypothetical protein